MHFIHGFDLLITSRVSFLEFIVLFLENRVFSLSLVMLFLKQVDELIFGLIL